MNFRSEHEAKKPLSVFTLSSLTDIVLLLLIFFLLTSSFVTNFGIRVNVPRAESSAQVQQQFVNVAITPQGEFFLDGERVAREQLAVQIRALQQQSGVTSLVIRADRDATVDDAVHVMNIAQSLSMSVLMATERTFR
ncbi:outer membrane transport energization protein ExbD [Cyclonatronum proteinivorum]|uniref:Outer membrane transport energization protein ExbD n=1 Tax=Cyclonatronum proteinivorum TaxID=1457365 RepID=A0A345UJE8_9BACT|nr:biopolymer transporter ExbD [Cyclonatronum proteinivorum]AXJ00600.1 outer membrane transport energization protein ExbD [Cyclonatronum proteinivorum]